MAAVANGAVSGIPASHPAAGPQPESLTGRRAVAVAVNPMELLRPRSDLARLAESFERVDLLFATEDGPSPGGVVVLPTESVTVAGSADREADDEDDSWAEDSWADDDDEDPFDEVMRGIEGLGIDGISVHRLGLRLPLPASAESDVVAALSELVGFDPEPGVYCLAPALVSADPARSAVNRAAERIAQVYGIPLLRYRCLELSVVGADSPGVR